MKQSFRLRWLTDLRHDGDQQHDDRAGHAYADILQAFQPRADALIAQRAHFLMRVQPGCGLVDGRHGVLSLVIAAEDP